MEWEISPSLTVQGLNSLYVIIRELDIRFIALVPRIHDGFSYVGMLQTQTMSKFMNRYPVQVDTIVCSCGEAFTVVKMRIT